jgi:hypothetical protein
MLPTFLIYVAHESRQHMLAYHFFPNEVLSAGFNGVEDEHVEVEIYPVNV